MWEKHDKNSDEYKSWKLSHINKCDINFDGSAGMEPTGILELFQRSLNFNIRYKNFISDGYSKTFAVLSEAENIQLKSLIVLGMYRKGLVQL